MHPCSPCTHATSHLVMFLGPPATRHCFWGHQQCFWGPSSVSILLGAAPSPDTRAPRAGVGGAEQAQQQGWGRSTGLWRGARGSGGVPGHPAAPQQLEAVLLFNIPGVFCQG